MPPEPIDPRRLRRAAGQRRVLLELFGRLEPHWRRDPALPARIERLLRADRRFGSGDRRLYRELVYTALRYLPWIEPLLGAAPDRAVQAVAWLAADEPATAGFRAATAGDWPPCPASAAAKAAHLRADPAEGLPAWLREECPEAFDPPQLDVLLSRAPLWLRLRPGEDAAALAEFSQRGWAWRRSGPLPLAVAVTTAAEVAGTEAYRRGAFEVQDLGSQLVLESVGIEPGGRWLDACAGAGGKSLQLAGLLGPAGRVEARDIRPVALAELGRRAARAGLSDQITAQVQTAAEFVRIRPPSSDPAQAFDGVLIDAPCSGSGTWRRAPHLKWCTTAADVARQAGRQLALLGRHAPLVRPGGRLVYATCSLCRSENQDVVAAFLAAHPEFEAAAPARAFTGVPRGAGLLFPPAAHDGDGFFVASLRRRPL